MLLIRYTYTNIADSIMVNFKHCFGAKRNMNYDFKQWEKFLARNTSNEYNEIL